MRHLLQKPLDKFIYKEYSSKYFSFLVYTTIKQRKRHGLKFRIFVVHVTSLLRPLSAAPPHTHIGINNILLYVSINSVGTFTTDLCLNICINLVIISINYKYNGKHPDLKRSFMAQLFYKIFQNFSHWLTYPRTILNVQISHCRNKHLIKWRTTTF